MNKKQVKILIKIILRATILLVIVAGVIGYFYSSVYLTYKNKKMLTDSKVQKVIRENRGLQNTIDIVTFKGLYEFELPHNLKVKDIKVQDRFKKQKTITHVNSANLILQPLESGVAEVKIKYERSSEYIDEKQLESFSKIDLKYLEKTHYELYEYHEKYTEGVHIIEKYPLEIIKINGKSCLRGSFVSQEGRDPKVFTQIYEFYGGYDTLEIKMDFIIEEEFEWGPSFLKLIQSFKFYE